MFSFPIDFKQELSWKGLQIVKCSRAPKQKSLHSIYCLMLLPVVWYQNNFIAWFAREWDKMDFFAYKNILQNNAINSLFLIQRKQEILFSYHFGYAHAVFSHSEQVCAKRAKDCDEMFVSFRRKTHSTAASASCSFLTHTKKTGNIV